MWGIPALVFLIAFLHRAAPHVIAKDPMHAFCMTRASVGRLLAVAPAAARAAGLSWRGALIVVGAVPVAGALLCAALVRDRPASGPEARPQGGSLRDMMDGMVRVLRNPYTWPPFLCFFFLYAAMGNFFLWSVPFLRDVYGLTTTKAALYASLPSMALLASAPFTGYLSDRVLRRRKLPYTVLASGQFLVWLAFVLTLGTLPLPGVCLLFLLLGVMGVAFVLTWPLGAEVNPPGLAGIAVAATKLGGFVGAALTQAPIVPLLHAGGSGPTAKPHPADPAASYRGSFALCALFVLIGAATTCLLHETRGTNVHHRLPPAPASAGSAARS